MSEYSEALRQRLRSLPPGSPPEPWERVEVGLVGGVHSVGFGVSPTQLDLLLVASWSGRSVLDGLTGERLARDRDESVAEWTGELGEDCQGIGPLDGQRIPMAGIWGGGLLMTTLDGWSIARLAVDWPEERIVLQPPGADILAAGRETGCVQLGDPVSEVRAAGFSRSGRVLVIATSSDLIFFARSIDLSIQRAAEL